jgi:hypothetical protein
VSAGPPLHPYALLTPWYAIERSNPAIVVPRPRRPIIQKYDSPEFVRQIMTDPTVSLKFAEEVDPKNGDDLWSVPYPVPFASRGDGKAKLLTHKLRRSKLRKLYQPSHNRFYTVTTELFCEEPGLPRPSTTNGVEVGFVLRRVSFRISLDNDGIRKFLRNLDPERLTTIEDQDLKVVLATELEADPLLIPVQRVVEAWGVDAAGRGSWVMLKDGNNKEDHDKLVHEKADKSGNLVPTDELTISMWRIPPRPSDCRTASTRALFFGVVPTFSSEHGEDGLPKLDDRAIYELRCFVRSKPVVGHEGCPLPTWWSDVSEPFRLASFFDPDGTRNRTSTIRMPDLRTLASQAGQPVRGVTFDTPAGSGLTPKPAGSIPTSGTVDNGETCTFSIELLTIVAKFVFSIFLPIVTFVFQLWWMLLLRFCWPLNDQANLEFAALLAVGPDPSTQAGMTKAEGTTAVGSIETAPSPTGLADPGKPFGTLPDPLCAIEVGP